MHHRVHKSTSVLHWIISSYFLITSLIILFNISSVTTPETNFKMMMFITILGAVYIPKLLFCTFDLIFYLTKKRWRKIQYAGYIVAILAFLLIMKAIHYNRFNFEKREVEITLPNLPQNFDNYKIVQISDFHLGSFTLSQKKLEPLFDSINAQNADIIVFTGDMVNSFASECNGWSSLFQRLRSKDTMLAVLGNHDYSTYYKWPNEDLKSLNEMAVRSKIRDFGFDLLLNTNKKIQRGEEKITFIGIENWGKYFTHTAQLDKAMEGVDSTSTKILLSHDPTFWGDSICGITDIELTLSGHTHASQFGIETPWFKWSPASWAFDYWDDLYEKNNQYIFVSRGIGCVGVPGRIGMDPQYTVITLKCSKRENHESN